MIIERRKRGKISLGLAAIALMLYGLILAVTVKIWSLRKAGL